MSLSLIQKKAIVKILFDLSIIDGHADKNEAILFGVAAEALDLKKEDVEDAAKLSVSQSILILESLDFETKKLVGQLMFEMIKADGIIQEEEVDALVKISLLAGIPLPK
jgi:uncharacterized tellurite resistance protein B-like protein